MAYMADSGGQNYHFRVALYSSRRALNEKAAHAWIHLPVCHG